MIGFLQNMLLRHPRARKVIVLRPLNGAFEDEIEAATTALADDRVSYIDTTSWTDVTFTDGLHSDEDGRAAAAAHVVAMI
jgi:lysophospholipase L1-like esterase